MACLPALGHGVQPGQHREYPVDQPIASTSAQQDGDEATCNLVDAAAEANARFIHLSTDLVLNGRKGPYDEMATPHPIMHYGRAKTRAEAYVREHIADAAIVRTSLILSLDPINLSSQWIVDAMREQKEITLFVDKLRSLIGAADLATMLWELSSIDRDRAAGMWNFVGPEALSRYTIGLLLAQALDLDPSCIKPVHSSESPTPRPRDLRMSGARVARLLQTRPRTATEVLLNL